MKIDTNACAGSTSEVRYLEHVQAVVSANATRRGDLELFLTSPMGTRSMILSRRANDDDSRDGFTKWPFMTTHTWGEYPQGTWTLEARFNGGTAPSSATGWLRGWSLVLHGTRAPPYAQLQAQDPHSKLAVVKKAHEDNAPE
ncbi:Neuroendocrine convertase 2 [Eumeta japonica]|uniref:Neuroendocrine convertase 2 n=1 Tax=Eumeta variegata TaxID=151549 RepID=A0A4C1TJ71_EUMVA|nr:Neuroendocrine convertase 2 [Eumeta japonica]